MAQRFPNGCIHFILTLLARPPPTYHTPPHHSKGEMYFMAKYELSKFSSCFIYYRKRRNGRLLLYRFAGTFVVVESDVTRLTFQAQRATKV